MKIKILRKNLDSFFLLEQDIPEGMEAFGMESQGAEFSYENKKVKYTWLRLPKTDEIQVMYKVKASADALGRKEISGRYYYIQNEEKQEFLIPAIGVHVEKYEDPAQTEMNQSLNHTENQAQNAIKNDGPDYLEYKIQLLSSAVKLDTDSLKKVYGLKEKVDEVFSNDVYKYTAGTFPTLDLAKSFKQKLKAQKFVPFIIAFNKGIRIPLQEADEIAKKNLENTK